MNRILYRLTYWLGITHWDTGETPPEVQEAFQSGDIPSGTALDLGCGTGTNTIFMAKQGRQAIGLDFVPEAIRTARERAQQAGVTERAQFLVADVTHLDELHLPASGFALDMGCFHGLSQAGQERYARGLAKILIPGGRFMLYTLYPRKEAGFAIGVQPEMVQSIFAPWFDITHIEHGVYWSNGKSALFWMDRKS